MDERVKTDHRHIVEALPDYAVGALDDVTAERVARHLPGCATCRDHLAFVLETVALLAPARPPAAARRALLARAAADETGVAQPRPAFPAAVPIPVPPASIPTPPSPARPRAGAGLRRVAPVWLAAALLLAPLIGWGAEWQRRQDEQDEWELIHRLVTNPAAVHTLDNDYQPTEAVAIFYVDPTEDQGYLVARDLPPLPTDQRYQVWLQIDGEMQMIRAGALPVGADGEGKVLLRAPAPFSTYYAAQIIPEPSAGDPSPFPSALPVLGGEIETVET